MKRLIILFSFLCLCLVIPHVAKAQENRISGADRFEVAVNISKQYWPDGSGTIILTNYLANADAISATPLAFQENAPILLTHPDRLTQATKQEIIRLKPEKAILVGGIGSLNSQIINELKALNVDTITRIDGKDRFEVSANIASKIKKPQAVVVANGTDYANALSIAPYAAAHGYPILLTDKNQLPKSVQLQVKSVQQSIIVGGVDSVGEKIERVLSDPLRINGANQYEISANIAKTFFPHSEKAFFTSENALADALTGSVVAAKENAPIFLTGTDKLDEKIQSYLINKQVSQITLLGGVETAKYYQPGNWMINNPGGNKLQGYTDKTSYLPGDKVQLYINSSENFNIEVYRMGYYNGEGAQIKGTYGEFPAFVQTASPNYDTMDANWNKTEEITIPSNWESGMYIAKIIDSDLKESYIPFVIKNPNPKPNGIGLVISANTYQAYNSWGGKSLYSYNSTDGIASTKVSFNRPYLEGNGAGEFFSYEYNMVRWLEEKGYSISYYTDQDIDQGYIRNSHLKLLLFPGHDEYWTMKIRNEIENLSASTMNLGLFNANTGFWQVRYEDNNRTIVGYKDKANLDPYQTIDPSLVTTQFGSSPVNRSESILFGNSYEGVPDSKFPLVVSNASHWLYEGTGLKDGDQIPGVIGGEIDRYHGSPSNVEVIAHSPAVLYGQPNYSDVVWYQKPGGGKVFAVGTFLWNWFLDPFGHEDYASYNSAIEKITLNALNNLMK